MRIVVCAFALLAGLFAGCSSEPARVTLRGKVTLDGNALEKGVVEFVPADGKTPSAKGGVIVGGEYTAEVVPGEVIVKITSPKVVDKKKRYDTPDSPVDDVLAEQVPKKYNEESKLKETIATGQKELDFKLVTK
jgi:hypothetical protein